MKRIYFLIAVLAVAAISCNRFQDNIDDSSLEFIGETENGDGTRTTFATDGDKYTVLWDTGDLITVSDGNNHPVYKAKSGGSTTDVFKKYTGRDVSSSAGSYTAVYPSTLWTGSRYELPAGQTYVEGQPYQYPMIASTTTQSFKFKNPCGVLRLYISSQQRTFNVAGLDIESDLPISGPVEIDFEHSSVTVMEGGSYEVSLGCPGDGVAITKGGEPVPFDIVLPTGKHHLTVTVWTKGDTKQIVQSAEAVPITASHITRNYITVNSFIENVCYGDANCVIAKPGVAKSFSVAPHSVGADCLINKDAPVEGLPLASSASVVWSEFNGNVSLNLNSSAKTLTVTTPAGEYGNALVAIKNGSAILWSYHIWVPEDDPTKVLEYNTMSSLSPAPKIMPMLLGATKIVKVSDSDATKLKAAGLYYQWGRKDPMPRMKQFTSSDQKDNVLPSILATTILKGITTHQTTTAIDYATKHPDTYIAWTSPDVAWYGTEKNDNLWKAQKTVYDPCPAGYHVAPSATWRYISDVSRSSGAYNKGITYKVGTGASGDIYDFYVTCGDRYGGQAEPLGGYVTGSSTKVRCWSCNAYGSSAEYLSITSSASDASIGNHGTSHSARGFALPLRCCKDQ